MIRRKIINVLKVMSILAFLGISIYLMIYMNNNKDFAYMGFGKSENFRYDHNMFLRDNGYYVFVFGQLEILNNDIDKNNIKEFGLYCDEQLIVKSSNILNGSLEEKKGYNEYFPDYVVDNMNRMYYEITYIIDGVEKTERINISFYQI